MPIVTQCDACGKKYRIPDHQAGNFLPCKNCGEDMYVDDGGVGATALPRRSSAGGRTSSSGGGMPGWALWAAAGGGGVALLVIVGLIVSGMSGGGDDSQTKQVAENTTSTTTPDAPPVTPGTNRPTGRAGTRNNTNQPTTTNTSGRQNPFKRATGNSSRAAETKVIDWNVAVDPVPPELAVKLSQQVPPSSTPLALGANQRLIIPKTASHYILTPKFPRGGFIHDLSAGGPRQLTSTRISLNREAALSPGGGHFAMIARTNQGTELQFYDAREETLLGSTPIGSVEELFFANEQQVLALTDSDIIIFDLQAQEELGRIENVLTSDPFRNGELTVVSHGGRVLADYSGLTDASSTFEFNFIDLQQMKNAGKLELKNTGGGTAKPIGIDFSHDGRFVAILISDGSALRLVLVEVESGDVLKDLELKNDQLEDLLFGSPPKMKKLAWFPDNRRLLLIGRGVWDVAEERLIHVVENDETLMTTPYQPVTSTQVVGVTGSPASPRLSIVNLPIDAAGSDSPVASNNSGGSNPFQKVTAADGTKNPFQKAGSGLKKVPGWQVAVDPPVEELAYDMSGKIRRLRVRLGSGYNHNIVTPVSFSPYVAVPSGNGYDVYDLRTGSIRARTKVGFDHFAKSTLSPGAKFFATTVGTFGKGGFGIYDIDEKKDLGSVEIEDVQDIMFASEEKIVVLTGKELSVYEVQTGVKLNSMDFSSGRGNRSTLSPGGRYLADLHMASGISDDVLITVYDLEQLRTVGELKFEKGEGGIFTDLRGIAFSPDGEQLAAVTTARESARILVWDVYSGRQLDDFEVKREFDRLKESNRSSSWSGKNDLAWFPDKKRLLLMDYGIVDREVGELVYILPSQNGSSSFRWPASATQVVGITGSSRSASLESINLPVDLFDQAAKVIESGGQAIDTLLPPITHIKVGNLAPPQLPQGGWSVTADPAPQPMERLIPKTLEFKLPRREGYFSQFFLSDAAGGKAVIARKTSANRWRSSGEPIVFQAWLNVYDLSRGKELGELELPYPADAIAFSPSGKYVVTRDAEDQERLDIWDPDAEQHELGFRPHADLYESGSKKTGRSDYWETIRLDLSVKAARFLDDEHLITLSGEDRLRCWKLPECSLVYEVMDIGVPGISPGGSLLVVHDKGSVMVRNARTGKILGQLEAPGEMTSAAFHNNGRLLAVTVARDADYFLYEWDLESGEKLTSFPLPMEARQIRFTHDNYVLINDRNLVDLTKKAVAWNYLFPQPSFLPFSIDHRVLYCGPKRDRRPILYLTAVELPGEALQERIENSSLSAEFIPLAGKSFSLTTSISAEADLKKAAIENCTGRIESLGGTVKDNGRFDLVLKTEEKEGRSQDYRVGRSNDPFSGGFLGPSLFGPPADSEIVSANIRNVECSLTLVDSRQEVWRTARTYSNFSSGVRFQEGSSLQQELDKRLTSGIESFFLNTPLPTFVFPAGAKAGLGRSQLDEEGNVLD